jgi:hypothetical protein
MFGEITVWLSIFLIIFLSLKESNQNYFWGVGGLLINNIADALGVSIFNNLALTRRQI